MAQKRAGWYVQLLTGRDVSTVVVSKSAVPAPPIYSKEDIAIRANGSVFIQVADYNFLQVRNYILKYLKPFENCAKISLLLLWLRVCFVFFIFNYVYLYMRYSET